MEKILAHIDAHLDAALADLFALMRIPSISAQPDHAPDCRAAAEWARGKLAALGFEARLVETAGLPGVIATDHRAGPGAPHILFYGHYDVQPADPLELWETPPFSPCIVEGARGKEIRGRGAVDDKGQVVSFLSAVAAHLAVNGVLPVRLTVFLEGEEVVRESVAAVAAAGGASAAVGGAICGRGGHQYVGCGDAGDHRVAAWAGGSRSGCARANAGPAFRAVWRAGGQSDP
jgi:acetylornithine deacetylase/succinyl-diaminopimelate desuccinylase-like protein